jgi:hypothetical protein
MMNCVIKFGVREAVINLEPLQHIPGWVAEEDVLMPPCTRGVQVSCWMGHLDPVSRQYQQQNSYGSGIITG